MSNRIDEREHYRLTASDVEKDQEHAFFSTIAIRVHQSSGSGEGSQLLLGQQLPLVTPRHVWEVEFLSCHKPSHRLLPLPVFLTSSGYPWILSFFHRKKIRRKDKKYASELCPSIPCSDNLSAESRKVHFSLVFRNSWGSLLFY